MPRPRSLPFFFDSAARLAKPSPIGELQAFVHHMSEVAAVIGDAGLNLVRHGGSRNEIAPPDLDDIDADDLGRAVEQLLDQKGRFRPPGAAIGRERNGVGEDGMRDGMHRRNLIDAGRQAYRKQRHHHRRAEYMRAHGVQRADAQAENLALVVEREFAGDDLIAAVRIAEKRLRARRHPFHRPAADAARRPRHQRVLRIAAVLHAETAADIRRDHAHFRLGDFQHLAGDGGTGAVRILRGRIERVIVAFGMIMADRGARLDRIGADARVVQLELDDVLGLGKGGVGRVLVAHHQRERDVVRRLVPQHRRAGLHRVLDADHRRQRLVVDLDKLGGAARLIERFGDDKGDALADSANLLAFEDRPQRAKAFRPAHVLRHRRRQRTQSVSRHIGAGEHGEHAVGGLGLCGIDPLDPRMGVRRHDDDAVALMRQVEVVDIAAAAGDKARILDPRYGLTDAEFLHAFPPRQANVSPLTARETRQFTCDLRR